MSYDFGSGGPFWNGIPMTGGFPLPSTQGKVWHVKPYSGSDGNSGKAPNKAFKTLSKALSAATANKNDVVLLYGESNTAANTFDFLTAALDWNKDGVHLVGVGAGPFIGSRAGLRNSTSVLTIEDLFTISANNCLIANISVFMGDCASTAISPRAMVVSGTGNRIINSQLSGIGHASMDTAGARSLAVTGSENYFNHCYIGLNTIKRSICTTEVYLTTGARNVFEDCMIDSYTTLSTFKAVTVGASDRFVLLKNCILNAVQNIPLAVAPTGAIASGAVNGSVLFLNGGVFGYTDVTTADDPKTLVLTHGALAANIIDMGVAKGTDVAV
jgi:hypothetical protein